jgi:hypothetical protein
MMAISGDSLFARDVDSRFAQDTRLRVSPNIGARETIIKGITPVDGRSSQFIGKQERHGLSVNSAVPGQYRRSERVLKCTHSPGITVRRASEVSRFVAAQTSSDGFGEPSYGFQNTFSDLTAPHASSLTPHA